MENTVVRFSGLGPYQSLTAFYFHFAILQKK